MQLPKTPSLRLDGRRALVPGASSGIGLGAATALARAGAKVCCVGRNAARLDALCTAFDTEGLTAEALPLDITNIDSVRKELASRPPFDIVVNSAGLARHTAALDTTPENYDSVMNINLRAAYFLSTAAAERMINAGRPGSIIHVSSQMGHVGGIDRSVYCASKHALEGMMKAMAIEWGKHDIRINTICPTFIRTPLSEQTLAIPERRAWIESNIQLGRIGEIQDIMGAVIYLASDAAALVTGTALMIDGGWTAE
ncbi:SDR family NAD(P)-dependent oxidoreductase [Nioella sp.]|uniref:SDR family NAD(P)-dependent oxidoreductase n=1 Tax=Nioella sp. TaxID=1912091 RepID=UPI003A8B943E